MDSSLITELFISPCYQKISHDADQAKSIAPYLSNFFPGGLAGFTYPGLDMLFLTEGAANLLGLSMNALAPGSHITYPFQITSVPQMNLMEEAERQFHERGQFHISFTILKDERDTHVRLDGGVAQNDQWGTYLLCVFSNITIPICEYAEMGGGKARYDKLTGLYDRDSVQRICSSYLKWDGVGQNHALFLMDIDNFKSAGSSLGRSVTDEILHALGALLSGAFRSDDVIGRLGDDEFFILMKKVPDRFIVEKRAMDVCRMVSRLFMEFEFPPGSCSIGVTYGSLGELTLEENLSNADLALYRSKLKGKNNWSICEYDSASRKISETAFGDAGRCSEL